MRDVPPSKEMTKRRGPAIATGGGNQRSSCELGGDQLATHGPDDSSFIYPVQHQRSQITGRKASLVAINDELVSFPYYATLPVVSP